MKSNFRNSCCPFHHLPPFAIPATVVCWGRMYGMKSKAPWAVADVFGCVPPPPINGDPFDPLDIRWPGGNQPPLHQAGGLYLCVYHSWAASLIRSRFPDGLGFGAVILVALRRFSSLEHCTDAIRWSLSVMSFSIALVSKTWLPLSVCLSLCHGYCSFAPSLFWWPRWESRLSFSAASSLRMFIIAQMPHGCVTLSSSKALRLRAYIVCICVSIIL